MLFATEFYPVLLQQYSNKLLCHQPTLLLCRLRALVPRARGKHIYTDLVLSSARAPLSARQVFSWGVDGNWLPLGRAAGDPKRPGHVSGLPVRC